MFAFFAVLFITIFLSIVGYGGYRLFRKWRARPIKIGK